MHRAYHFPLILISFLFDSKMYKGLHSPALFRARLSLWRADLGHIKDVTLIRSGDSLKTRLLDPLKIVLLTLWDAIAGSFEGLRLDLLWCHML